MKVEKRITAECYYCPEEDGALLEPLLMIREGLAEANFQFFRLRRIEGAAGEDLVFEWLVLLPGIIAWVEFGMI